ncbi:MAG: FAD-dependent thymidylate synthase [Clostridia bacterium]
MRLIKPSYQILAASGKADILPYNYEFQPNKLIELAGRTCYKSEGDITLESSIEFIDKIKKRKHLSVLEHSWELRYYKYPVPRYKFLNYMQFEFGTLVAGNNRAFNEANIKDEKIQLKPSQNMIEDIYTYHRWDMLSASAKLIINRGISHEIIRHRPVSYSQESTRYCNYSKNKFSGHVTYIIPPWTKFEPWKGDLYNIPPEEVRTDIDHQIWFKNLLRAERDYFELLKNGWTPQQARDILPNALKTEIVITCSLQEWIYIFNLRALGTTGTPHPQMGEIMLPLYENFKNLFPEAF